MLIFSTAKGAATAMGSQCDGKQASRLAGWLAGRQAGRAGRQAGKQASKQANMRLIILGSPRRARCTNKKLGIPKGGRGRYYRLSNHDRSDLFAFLLPRSAEGNVTHVPDRQLSPLRHLPSGAVLRDGGQPLRLGHNDAAAVLLLAARHYNAKLRASCVRPARPPAPTRCAH